MFLEKLDEVVTERRQAADTVRLDRVAPSAIDVCHNRERPTGEHALRQRREERPRCEPVGWRAEHARIAIDERCTATEAREQKRE